MESTVENYVTLISPQGLEILTAIIIWIFICMNFDIDKLFGYYRNGTSRKIRKNKNLVISDVERINNYYDLGIILDPGVNFIRNLLYISILLFIWLCIRGLRVLIVNINDNF